MKRISIIIIGLLLLIPFSLPASASAMTNPGIKPGSFFYFFDTTFEKIGLFFTFSPEKKAEKALTYADERLAEAEAIAGNNNVEAIKTAITNYESNITLATEKSKEVQDKERAENLFTLIADNTSKNQEVLSAVLIKVPEEAKEAITRAIEANRRGQEEAAKQIAELKSEIEQLKKEVADLKAENAAQTKTVEELDKQKSEGISAPAKSPTPPVTPNQSQALPKANKPQGTPSTNQQPTNTNISPPPVIVTSPTPPETLEITSVSVVPDMTSAKVEWQTNKPTESKVFISGGNFSSKMFLSGSGFSLKHTVNIESLSPTTNYSYEITAVNELGFIRKSGIFTTLDAFVSEIYIDKEEIKNDGVDFVTIQVTTKLTNGKVLPNKSLKLKTSIYRDGTIFEPFEETKISDNQGVIIFRTKPTKYYDRCGWMKININIIDIEDSDKIIHSKDIKIINVQPTPSGSGGTCP